MLYINKFEELQKLKQSLQEYQEQEKYLQEEKELQRIRMRNKKRGIIFKIFQIVIAMLILAAIVYGIIWLGGIVIDGIVWLARTVFNFIVYITIDLRKEGPTGRLISLISIITLIIVFHKIILFILAVAVFLIIMFFS